MSEPPAIRTARPADIETVLAFWTETAEGTGISDDVADVTVHFIAGDCRQCSCPQGGVQGPWGVPGTVAGTWEDAPAQAPGGLSCPAEAGARRGFRGAGRTLACSQGPPSKGLTSVAREHSGSSNLMGSQ
jgi:hypothetical protein